MNWIKLLGLIGGSCFAGCGVPAAIMSVRTGKTNAPLSICWMILLGALCLYFYLLGTYGFDWLLTMNYSVEAVSWAIIVFYHYFPRAEVIKPETDYVTG